VARTHRTMQDNLPNLRLFDGCDLKERRAIVKLATGVSVQEGRVLIRQGHTGSEFFIVLSGFASCEIDGRRVARFGAGDFFGEIALLDGGPRTASVSATTAMDLLVFNRGEFVALIELSGKVAHRLSGELAARLRAANAA
jgi:CRP/FNR family cyclic AMP-dependent transcriptional regulator